MKKLLFAFTLILGLGFLTPGCSSKPTVDPSQAEKTFANADPAVKAKVQKGIEAIKASEYGKALVILEELSYDLDDPDQQSVLMDLVQQIDDVLGDQVDAAKKAAQEELKEATNHTESATEEAAEEHEMPESAATNAVNTAKAAKDTATKAAQDTANKAATEAAKKLQKQ